MLHPADIWTPDDIEKYIQSPSVHSLLLRESCRKLGIRRENLGGKLYRLSKPGYPDAFECNRRLQNVGVVASHIARSKPATKAIFQAAGLRVAQGRTFKSDQQAEARDYWMSMNVPGVVKPASGAGGVGVATDIRSAEEFDLGWLGATATGATDLIVEEYIKGMECRVFVVKDHVSTVTLRHPAQVVGDGERTVSELVAVKAEARKRVPFFGRKPFVLNPVMIRRLQDAGKSPSTVLPAGYVWRLHEISNMSSGGESEDFTDRIHPAFAAIAVRACHAIPGLGYAGVDIMGEDLSRSPDGQSWAICEVNADPEFALQHFHVHGHSRDAATALLEALF